MDGKHTTFKDDFDEKPIQNIIAQLKTHRDVFMINTGRETQQFVHKILHLMLSIF